jgi:hypothetical protein
MDINHAFTEMVNRNNQITIIQIQADMRDTLERVDCMLEKYTDELNHIRRLTLKAWAWGGFDHEHE